MIWHYLIVLGNGEPARPGAAAGLLPPRSPPTTRAAAARRLSGARPARRGSSTGWSPRPLAHASARCGTRVPRAGRRAATAPGAGRRVAPPGPARGAGWPGDAPAARVLPGRAAAAGRPDAGRLRRLLVPRATPATRPRSTRRPRELAPQVRGVWVVDARPRARPCRRGVDLRGRRHARVLPGAGPGPVPGQQRQLPGLRRQAAGQRARADPPRHAGQGDGPGPAARTRSARRDGLRRAAAPAATAGTTASPPTRSPPRSGSAPTRPRTRRWRSATRATTGWSPPTADEVAPAARRARHRARTSGSCCTRRRTASTSPGYRPPLDLGAAGRRARPGRRAAGARRTTSTTEPAPAAAPAGTGCATSRPPVASRTSASPPTCWSPTTRR